MNEQEQRIALCQWAGWRIEHQNKEGTNWVKPDGDIITHWKDEPSPLPDTNSLDVLHSFEMKLDYDQQHQYGEALRIASDNVGPRGGQHPLNGFGCFALATVTAEQRRRALLVTLNLWREDSNEGRK